VLLRTVLRAENVATSTETSDQLVVVRSTVYSTVRSIVYCTVDLYMDLYSITYCSCMYCSGRSTQYLVLSTPAAESPRRLGQPAAGHALNTSLNCGLSCIFLLSFVVSFIWK